jgi:hypothetical protein
VRLDGWLQLVVDEAPLDCSTLGVRNAELVERAAMASNIELFAVPTPHGTPIRFGVRGSDRAQLLEALSTITSEPVYVAALTPSRGSTIGPPLLAQQVDLTSEPFIGDSWAVYVNRRDVRSGAALGLSYACRIDTWTRDPDGSLTTTATNPVATVVPATQQTPAVLVQAGREWPTMTPFAAPTPDEIGFPIDVVYTWVDGDDPAWQQRKVEHMERLGLAAPKKDTSLGTSRFRTHDELRYSLRSLEQFAPWVRHIYLVTDNQTPEWLDTTAPGLTVVDHAQILEPEQRPCFNSHAISARLHRIPGLSDRYLLFNDDVLLGRPVDPRLFFDSNGSARYFLSAATITPGPPEPGDSPLLAARRRTAQLIEREFGIAPTRAFKHTPVAQLRDVHRDLEQRFADEIASTLSHPFRDGGDIAVAGWLHNYYAYFTQRALAGRIAYDYFRITESSVIERLDRLLIRRNLDAFCLNDSEDGDLSEEARAEALDTFLTRYFPIRSRFER